MTRVVHVLFALLLATSPAFTQASKPRPTRNTWYEKALRHINPDDTDYGAIWEQRKREFFAQLGNRHFQYDFCATLAIVLLLTLTFVQRLSHKRALDVAAQSIADVIRHDEYSRQVAREAIQRYNEHIEACNREIEARHEGVSKSVSATENELQRTRQELADTRAENKALRNDPAMTRRTVDDMSPGPTLEQEEPAQTEKEAKFAAYIKTLEKQIREERRKNQHLKGTSVDDHRA